MKNIDSTKLKGLVGLSDNDIKGSLTKGVSYMTVLRHIIQELLEKEHPERNEGKPRNALLHRLFNPKKCVNPLSEKINNALFVKVQKVFLIYRWPMSPYITEKVLPLIIQTDDNFVFVLAKSNLKQQVLRFLKIYDGLLQVDNETVHHWIIAEVHSCADISYSQRGPQRVSGAAQTRRAEDGVQVPACDMPRRDARSIRDRPEQTAVLPDRE